MNSENTAKELLQYCLQQQDAMLALLEKMVRTNSYTWNKPGADAVAAIISQELQSMGLHVQKIAQDTVGDILIAKTKAAMQSATVKQILLCGHLDTVFPEEMDFSCFEHTENTLRGPGVIDMKGGLVAAIYALRALQRFELMQDVPITLIINTDEEVGSPFSTPLIAEEAKRSAFGYVFECSGLQGEVVIGRKGRYGFTITCTGKAGHAGQAGINKPSAILELAHKILALEDLNAPDKGLTCNVGRMQGGTSPNTVPQIAWADVDCRCMSVKDDEQLQHNINKIIAKQTLPGVQTDVKTTGRRPPMAPTSGTQKLFEILSECARTLHINVSAEHRGGVSDANTIHAAGTPVLDGLGPSGARDHSEDEYMIATSLAERTALAAFGMLATWRLYKDNRLFS